MSYVQSTVLRSRVNIMINQMLSEVTAVGFSFYYFSSLSSLSLYKRDMSEHHILCTINHMDFLYFWVYEQRRRT